MSSSHATGFPDTVVLPESAAPSRQGTPAGTDGKSAPAGGNPLPARLPAAPPPDAREVARELERMAQSLGRELRFEVNLDGGRTVIYVLERATGELIRRIPREELERLQSGNRAFDPRLFDERV